MTANYIQKSEILLRKDRISLIPDIDTILFDIDGVLVDVSLSYHQTITDTVQYYFCQKIRLTGDTVLVDQRLIDAFKMAGGFNDDWELTAGTILLYLWKMNQYEQKSLNQLKNGFPVIADLIRDNLITKGGLSDLIDWVEKNASSPEKIFTLWEKDKIFQIAKEFYGGEKYCYRLYGFHPQIIKQTKGNMEREKVLFQPQITEIIKKYHVGILTGRNRAEADLIIGRLGWDLWISPEAVVTSEDQKTKPSPDGIVFLLKYWQSGQALYIGDTADDLMTVKNLNRQYQKNQKQKCLSALVLGNDLAETAEKQEKKRYYMKNDVDILADNVNQIIRTISNWNMPG